eukprot:TRINITY_DN57898_c0_g1_i1.p1 TRINITY_DN57898_c0_g1~~TRINITY_DN57898_c0_g1_i1.p1  ORF type:complete len:632 (+),score=157.28 TRINITY_DN57898_c0_g1_i1:145-2040(+)
MNKVISGYFDDAHRGLERQLDGARGPAQLGPHVQLPKLRGESAGSDGSGGGGARGGGGSWDKPLKHSSSTGALELSKEQLNNGVQIERLQQTLQENAKLSRKLRAVQEQLAITSAKKEAFKAQSMRLEKEFKKTRDQSDTLQRELLDAQRDAGQSSKEAQEAMQMMAEMRKAHIMEVRLLQRGLAARGGDAASRNKVDEVADLVDKVGRAVVQRDEAIRDKTKLQSQLSKATMDSRALSNEVAKLRKQSIDMKEKLHEAQRKAQFRPTKAPPNAQRRPDLEDSDDEFELELSTFEKRLNILEEGPAGLDILASNLAKDKQNLEKRIRQQQETMRVLNKSIEDWKAVNADKDEQIDELNRKMEKMLQDQALMQEQIAAKRREIELQVEEEKAELEARIKQLQNEVDLAQSQAEGLEKVSSRLTKELVKVHGQYGTLDSGAAEAPPGDAAGEAVEQVLERLESRLVGTGETLRMEVCKLVNGRKELRAAELPSGEEVRLPIGSGLEAELGTDEPWLKFFKRVGVSLGPPKQIVIASRLGEREVTLHPADTSVILTICKYDSRRFNFSGMRVSDQRMLDFVVMEDSLTPELCNSIDACKDDGSLFDLLVAGLQLQSGDAGDLAFSASAALAPRC